MDFLQSTDVQIVVGVAVALLAIGVAAAYLNYSKKSKGPNFPLPHSAKFGSFINNLDCSRSIHIKKLNFVASLISPIRIIRIC